VNVRRILGRVAVITGLAVSGLVVTAGAANAVPSNPCRDNFIRLGNYHAAWSMVWQGMGNSYASQGDYALASQAYTLARTEETAAELDFAAAESC